MVFEVQSRRIQPEEECDLHVVIGELIQQLSSSIRVVFRFVEQPSPAIQVRMTFISKEILDKSINFNVACGVSSEKDTVSKSRLSGSSISFKGIPFR